MRAALPLLALAALAACEAPAGGLAPPVAAPPPEDACGAEALAAEFVGGDASRLLATTFAVPVRFIRPGDAVTQDFQPGRANFEIDAEEVVTRVYCG